MTREPRWYGLGGWLLCAGLACDQPAPRARQTTATEHTQSSDSAAEIPAPSTPDARASAPLVVGVTHEELLARADAEGQDAAEEPLVVQGRLVPEDSAYADETPADVSRGLYEMKFPDERADRPAVERVLRVDDQGDRLTALLYGTGFIIAPGYRIGARASMAGLALIGADQRAHRAVNPDELRQWFFGQSLPSSSTVSFRTDGDGLIATRGALSLSIKYDAGSPVRPLSCRMFVSLLLGGDAAAVRAGCEGVRSPRRVLLRSRGLPVLSFIESDSSAIQLPRASLAVPPREAAGNELSVPARGGEGGFFTPNELLALEPVRPANAPPVQRRPGWAPVSSQLEVNNNSASEVLVFIDDAAIGWLAAGRSSTFSGVQTGRHSLRARSIDGLFRTESTQLAAPGRWDVVPAPSATSGARRPTQ